MFKTVLISEYNYYDEQNTWIAVKIHESMECILRTEIWQIQVSFSQNIELRTNNNTHTHSTDLIAWPSRLSHWLQSLRLLFCSGVSATLKADNMTKSVQSRFPNHRVDCLINSAFICAYHSFTVTFYDYFPALWYIKRSNFSHNMHMLFLSFDPVR